jgi:hypothetical protein
MRRLRFRGSINEGEIDLVQVAEHRVEASDAGIRLSGCGRALHLGDGQACSA